MKKRRVKYLAINGAFFRSEFVSDELFSLKDEVKEFMLYDIKVQIPVLFTEKNDNKSSQKGRKKIRRKMEELQVVPTNEKPAPDSVIRGQPERYVPERILQHRIRKCQHQYLVTWECYPDTEATKVTLN
ncbi:kinase-like domain-containing protein [Rhizophagus irregularis DAOM 181602=DAOM 197198]|nr:kinase-like domain-containing protein [Rhizophagus irregularis DAOM 181602=DAOM 197198]